MPRQTTTSLSEGTVLLTRPHNGPGVRVHSESEGAFLHLSCAPAYDLDDATTAHEPPTTTAKDASNITTLRVAVGNASACLAMPVQNGEGEQILVSNMWVDAGCEVWMSTSDVRKHVVYGFTTSKPWG